MWTSKPKKKNKSVLKEVDGERERVRDHRTAHIMLCLELEHRMSEIALISFVDHSAPVSKDIIKKEMKESSPLLISKRNFKKKKARIQRRNK